MSKNKISTRRIDLHQFEVQAISTVMYMYNMKESEMMLESYRVRHDLSALMIINSEISVLIENSYCSFRETISISNLFSRLL